MPVYWSWLYRPKREGQTEEDKIIRKLSFKLPAVFRYNMLFALFFGVLGYFQTRQPRTLFYFYKFTPITMSALCYEQIHRYYCFINNLEPPKVQSLTMADIIRNKQKNSNYY